MDYKRTFNNISDIGSLMLQCGGEVYRVEESLEKLAIAYGFKDVSIFAIPYYFNITVVLPDHSVLTLSRRVRENRTNLDRLFELNSLIRQLCIEPIDNIALESKIASIHQIKVRQKLVFIGYGLTSGAFTGFFGGGITEIICGTIIGFGLYFVIWLFEILEVNSVVSTLLSSMYLALFGIIIHRLGWIENLDATTIGVLMCLVPGVAITNSLRDLIGGEYVSGLARMLQAILIATSIALGVGTIHIILGG